MPQARSWAVIPDLAVEIVSPTNLADEVLDKLGGVFQGWACGLGMGRLFSLFQRVYALHVQRRSIRILAPGDELDGGDVLPGFHLSITDLFKQCR